MLLAAREADDCLDGRAGEANDCLDGSKSSLSDYPLVGFNDSTLPSMLPSILLSDITANLSYSDSQNLYLIFF